ncbi:hypothetical protein HAX54_041970, partial [Datura stramonium]|nr:hypothetical protein [Datura stramonium]
MGLRWEREELETEEGLMVLWRFSVEEFDRRREKAAVGEDCGRGGEEKKKRRRRKFDGGREAGMREIR